MNEILSITNAPGEEETHIEIGWPYGDGKVHKIVKEEKVIGRGLHNDLTITCYVAYNGTGKKLIEINEGYNLEVRFV